MARAVRRLDAIAESYVARRAKRHEIGFPMEVSLTDISGGCDLLLKHFHKLHPLSKCAHWR